MKFVETYPVWLTPAINKETSKARKDWCYSIAGEVGVKWHVSFDLITYGKPMDVYHFSNENVALMFSLRWS